MEVTPLRMVYNELYNEEVSQKHFLRMRHVSSSIEMIELDDWNQVCGLTTMEQTGSCRLNIRKENSVSKYCDNKRLIEDLTPAVGKV